MDYTLKEKYLPFITFWYLYNISLDIMFNILGFLLLFVYFCT